MYRRLLAGTALLVIATAAQATSDAARRFGAREDVQQVSLSPDGKRVAISATPGRGMALMIASPDTGDIKTVLRSSGDPDQLTDCRWATSDRLTCGIDMFVDDGVHKSTFSRMIAVDADGQNVKMLETRTTSRSLGIAQDTGQVIDWQASESDASVLMT